MNNWTVFYSWQNSSPKKTNRVFIRAALDAALERIHVEDNAEFVGIIENAPRVDTGMEGVAGTPEVAPIMFEKITQSHLFLADVTLVGTEPADGGRFQRKTPNSNVLLEMGFAAHVLGWRRIICVMNEFFGTRQEQPFDVRNRRFPIDYNLNPANRDEGRHEEQLQNLTEWIYRAIRDAQAEENDKVRRAIARLDVCSLMVCSVYRNANYFRDLGQDPQNRDGLAPVLDVPTFRQAVQRLLDLDLLWTDVQEDRYAYHWTYLGRSVLNKLFQLRVLPRMPQAVVPGDSTQ